MVLLVSVFVRNLQRGISYHVPFELNLILLKKKKKRVPFYNYYYCSLCEALIYYPMYDVQIYDSVISVHKSSEYLYVLWLWM